MILRRLEIKCIYRPQEKEEEEEKKKCEWVYSVSFYSNSSRKRTRIQGHLFFFRLFLKIDFTILFDNDEHMKSTHISSLMTNMNEGYSDETN